jgi:ELWxxDGT repeat protein
MAFGRIPRMVMCMSGDLRQGGVLSRKSYPLEGIDEAGNAIATAFDIGIGTGTGTYTGALSSIDSNDYYKFTVNSSSSASYTFLLSDLTANANIQLLNSNGSVISTSTSSGISNEQITQSLTSGTYFVRIYGDSSVTTGYKFELKSVDKTPRLLKDINTDPEDSRPSNFASFNGWTYFAATDLLNGIELWKTDGTAIGTVLVKDINPGTEESEPRDFVVVGNTMFFTAYDSVNGSELWKTDGTTAGTVLVKDIYSGKKSSDPQNLIALGTNVYFTATDSTNGTELWRNDGTAAGTILVKDITPGTEDISPYALTVFNNQLYFWAHSSSGYELWRSDGTTTGTIKIREFDAANEPSALTVIGNRLCFSAYTSATGYELWASDGTSDSTMIIKDINAGEASSVVT